MSARLLLHLGLAATAMGCSDGPADWQAQTSSVSIRSTGGDDEDGGVVEQVHCPDPNECGDGNGTGVYYQEDGDAGMVAHGYKVFITTFVNSTTGVRVLGNYRDPAGTWHDLPTAASVVSADYTTAGVAAHYGVLNVIESDTAPTWTLSSSTGGRVPVSGSDLSKLKLHVSVGGPITWQYVLEFGAPTDAIHSPTGAPNGVSSTRVNTLHPFQMYWREDGSNAFPLPYCTTAANKADTVVFQQGMYVNPSTGSVKRDATTSQDVTFSCRWGALAMVYLWGYDYAANSDSKWYFDAGIHMKRASYCGDSRYYTKGGTIIDIDDDLRIQNDEHSSAMLEAYWTPTGALCLDLMRHPELANHWTRSATVCADGRTLRSCASVSAPWLSSAPAPSN